MLCGREYMYDTHLQARIFNKYKALVQPKEIDEVTWGLGAPRGTMVGKSGGLHWDLWGCECVESDGGEIEEVTQGFANLQMC